MLLLGSLNAGCGGWLVASKHVWVGLGRLTGCYSILSREQHALR